MITTINLDRTNYLEWSPTARIFIGSQRKLGYITRKVKEPHTNDASDDEWESENLTIMAWLLHSMQPSISRGPLFLRTANDIQEAVAKTY
ncbi:hypothetical protein AMTRI_Chr03g142190 [Amborella trichopoda]